MKKIRKKTKHSPKRKRKRHGHYSPEGRTIHYGRIYRLHTFGYVLIVSFIVIFVAICYGTLLFVFDTIERANESEMLLYGVTGDTIEFTTYESVEKAWETKHTQKKPTVTRNPFFPTP